MDVIRDQKADMEDDIWAWEDSIAEHEAEILNEVAMFGDSGPGSAVQLRESRQGLAELKARYNTLYPAAPVVLPAPVPVNPLAEDIPF